ncbi:MAG: hypothetical protein AAGA86_14635 [Bacteroidota bacterium]
METLVATVLIVVVFMMASMLLNNLFANNIRSNDSAVRQELLKLQYRHQNQLLQLPHYQTWEDWELEVYEEDWNQTKRIVFRAGQETLNKEIVVKR